MEPKRTLTVRMLPPLYEGLERLKEETGKSMEAIVRGLIEQAILESVMKLNAREMKSGTT